MRIWIVQDGEPIPGLDENTRDWRAAMLARALVARGHEVLWWASTFDHSRKRHRFDAPRTVELEPGLKVRLLHGPGYSHNKSLKRFWHHRVLAAAYAREAIDWPPPDLVFCSVPTLELAEQSVIYGRKRKLPVIVDMRDAWPDLYLNLFPLPLRRFARPFLAGEFRRAEYIYRVAEGITAISDTYLDWALQYAKRPRRNSDGVFPLGYNPLPTKAEDEAQTTMFQQQYVLRPVLVVAFIGIFGTSYDLETVVGAARQLQTGGRRDVQIVLAGDGDMAPRLREKARGLSNVVFTGWLDQSSLKTIMHITDVGLAAYSVGALQSLPNKPFEYMAAGLPLLSSLPGELERLIAEHQIGLHYRAGDVQSLTEKIVWLAEHPTERAAMGQRARKLFEDQFRADIIYPKLVAHLEQVAASTSATSPGTLLVQGKA